MRAIMVGPLSCGLPLLEILLGLGRLLDVVRGVLEGDEFATAGQGMGSSKARDQSATMP